MATYSGLKILGWRSSESDSACPASTSCRTALRAALSFLFSV
jgi:hypothetical protein